MKIKNIAHTVARPIVLSRSIGTAFVFGFFGSAWFCFWFAIGLVMLMLFAPMSAAIAQQDAASEVAVADVTPPADVENVQAVAGNNQVSLSWNVATDNGSGIKGYKVYYGTNSVVNDGDSYEKGYIDVGNKINHTVTLLNNGTTYYFALTAYDKAGNESENYSLEVSGIPMHAAADTESPKVVSAEAVHKQLVKVVFSEGVVVPATQAEAAFTVKNDATQVALAVTGAEIDRNDLAQKTVMLTTALQQAGASYVLTVGIQVKDSAGNPVVSGTSDTAVFSGTDLEPPVQTQPTEVAGHVFAEDAAAANAVAAAATAAAPAEELATADTVAPEIVEVLVSDASQLMVKFSEAVQLAADPTQNFIITEEANIENLVAVLTATLSANKTVVTLTTDQMQALNYNLIVVDVMDIAGNPISVDNNATVFTGVAETQQGDTVAPEDATGFMAQLLAKMIVRLTWTASLNSAGDLANYVLYKSTDGAVYSGGQGLDAASTSVDVSSLEPGMEHFFKLTAKDVSGNESLGAVTSFTLPTTGPELALLLLGSFGLGKFLQRRKKARK